MHSNHRSFFCERSRQWRLSFELGEELTSPKKMQLLHIERWRKVHALIGEKHYTACAAWLFDLQAAGARTRERLEDVSLRRRQGWKIGFKLSLYNRFSLVRSIEMQKVGLNVGFATAPGFPQCGNRWIFGWTEKISRFEGRTLRVWPCADSNWLRLVVGDTFRYMEIEMLQLSSWSCAVWERFHQPKWFRKMRQEIAGWTKLNKGSPMVPFKTVQNPCRRAVAAGRAARQRVRTALPSNFALDGVALRLTVICCTARFTWEYLN